MGHTERDSQGPSVAELMAELDWRRSPLGDPEGWPAALRTTTNLMLSSKFAMFAAWGPELALIYNDAYAEMLGAKHPSALGAPFEEVWREIWPDILPLVEAALRGEATYQQDLELRVQRRGYQEPAWFTFSYSPVHDEDGQVRGMFCAVAETTGKVRVERRQAFQLALDAELAQLHEAREIMDAAVAALGRHLKAERVGYSRVLEDGETILCESCYADGVEPLLGTFKLADFGAASVARQLSGAPEVWNDVADDPEQALETWAAIETRAFLSVPLVREGRLRASLYVNSKAPRLWSPDEVEIAEHVAARTWDAVERARAEAALRESEARFRMAAELNPDGVAVNRNGVFVYANQAAARFYGMPSAEALIGQSPMRFNAPEHRERVQRRIDTLMAGGKVETAELEIVRLDGSRLTVDVSAGLIAWEGAPAVQILLRDVTDRRRAEEAVRESERRFRNMADHAPVMMWVTEADGTCTYLNRSWYEFTGQDEAAALGYGWLEATHPDDRAMAEEVFRRANADQAPFRLEYRLRRSDGVYRWAIDAAAPRFSVDGEFLGYIGSVIDIQDRKEAEDQTLQGEQRLRAMMNAMPAFIWLGDPSGELHYFNDRWYEYTGQTLDEALPNGWTSTLHPDDIERTAADWAHARATGTIYQIEMRYRRRDGEYRWHLAKAEPIHDQAGVITAWLGVSLDIHDSKTAAEHQAMLINELNHRVKNTLATVQSMATQTVRNVGDPRAAHEAFMARLLALSAAHDVLTEQRWTGADLTEVVAGAARTFSQEPDRQFRVSGPPVRLSPKVALALAMALHELGTNASKYGALSCPDGWVSLEWRRVEPDRLVLVWREHGGPMIDAPPSRRGFGSRLLERGLASELNGHVKLDFRPEGLICEIEANLAAGAAD